MELRHASDAVGSKMSVMEVETLERSLKLLTVKGTLIQSAIIWTNSKNR
jgi:hypothetical protein